MASRSKVLDGDEMRLLTKIVFDKANLLLSLCAPRPRQPIGRRRPECIGQRN
jgi:hypothetical protein